MKRLVIPPFNVEVTDLSLVDLAIYRDYFSSHQKIEGLPLHLEYIDDSCRFQIPQDLTLGKTIDWLTKLQEDLDRVDEICKATKSSLDMRCGRKTS